MLVSASPVRPLMGTGRVGTSGITGVGAVERVVEVDVELDAGARAATEREREGPATGGGGMLPALPVAARERVEGPRRLAIHKRSCQPNGAGLVWIDYADYRGEGYSVRRIDIFVGDAHG